MNGDGKQLTKPQCTDSAKRVNSISTCIHMYRINGRYTVLVNCALCTHMLKVSNNRIMGMQCHAFCGSFSESEETQAKLHQCIRQMVSFGYHYCWGCGCCSNKTIFCGDCCSFGQTKIWKSYLFSWTDNVRRPRANMDTKIWCTSTNAYRHYALNHL